MTIRDFGCSASDIASVLVIIFFRSIVTPGTERGLPPVARMMFFVLIVSVTLPSFVTSIEFFSIIFAVPEIISILFFFIKYSTPFEMRSATPRLRAIILEKSYVSPV